MLFFIFLSVLALGAAIPPSGGVEGKPQPGNCPDFWFGYIGRCYRYVAKRMTWADAELFCVSQKANLVSIHNHFENDFIVRLIEWYDDTKRPTWIGLSDRQKEGAWMWSDGSQVDFLFWASRQPDNYQGKEHCGHNYGASPEWNDLGCEEKCPFVCATPKTVCKH